MFEFFSQIPSSLRQVFNITPENKYLAEQQARTIAAAQAQRAMGLANAQQAISTGTYDPYYVDTSDKMPKFIINISTATKTAPTKVVFGSKFAVENLYARDIDRSFTGNAAGVIVNTDMVNAAQQVFDLETYYFSHAIIETKPSDSTNTVNADNQLNTDFTVYNFGVLPGKFTADKMYMAGTGDPTAMNGLYRYVDLVQQNKMKFNRSTLWEVEVLPKVNLSIVFTAVQRVKSNV